MKNLDLSLHGNSGCRIDLIDGRVIKTSGSKEYNRRLILQGMKQKTFPLFNTPEIYEIGTNQEGLAYIDMGYCGKPSTSLESYNQSLFITVNHFITKNLTTNWCDFTEEIDSKFIETCLKFENKKLASAVLEKVKTMNKNLPIGYCHGDLTFSNILVDNSEFYFIDFLEEWIPSPAFDVCKILQDSRHDWYVALGSNKKSWVELMGSQIYDTYVGLTGDKTHIETIMLLTLCRVFPYCKTLQRKEHIEREICKLI